MVCSDDNGIIFSHKKGMVLMDLAPWMKLENIRMLGEKNHT